MKAEKARGWKKYIVGGCAFLLLLALLAGYLVFGISRPNRYTAYSPLTGKVFRLKSEEIDKISLTNGAGGRDVMYREREDLRVLAEYFNGFRCSYRLPKVSEEQNGSSCLITVYYLDGTEESFHLGSSAALIGRIWYCGETDYFWMPYSIAGN